MPGFEGAPLRGSRAKVKHHCGFAAAGLKAVAMKQFSILAPLAFALSLSACAVPTGPVEVTRFNRAAEGVTYGAGKYIVTPAPSIGKNDELMLSPYLAAVGREMQRLGYKEGLDNRDIRAEIAVDRRESKSAERGPVSVGVGGSTGGYRSGVGLGIGINLGGGQGSRVETILSVRMIRSVDNLVIWEGRASQVASAKSPAAQPGIAASKLAEALFSDFPGTSGETVTIP
jgi:hypothetical protein